jgi:hypothetical protein
MRAFSAHHRRASLPLTNRRPTPAPSRPRGPPDCRCSAALSSGPGAAQISAPCRCSSGQLQHPGDRLMSQPVRLDPLAKLRPATQLADDQVERVAVETGQLLLRACPIETDEQRAELPAAFVDSARQRHQGRRVQGHWCFFSAAIGSPLCTSGQPPSPGEAGAVPGTARYGRDAGGRDGSDRSRFVPTAGPRSRGDPDPGLSSVWRRPDDRGRGIPADVSGRVDHGWARTVPDP